MPSSIFESFDRKTDNSLQKTAPNSLIEKGAKKVQMVFISI